MDKYKHVEAYCLMQYECEECKHKEVLWNSRDGVTPFTIVCIKCGETAVHLEWGKDKRAPNYIPYVGQRIFIDMTLDRAKEIAKMRIAYFKKHNIWDPKSKEGDVELAIMRDIYGDGSTPDVQLWTASTINEKKEGANVKLEALRAHLIKLTQQGRITDHIIQLTQELEETTDRLHQLEDRVHKLEKGDK